MPNREIVLDTIDDKVLVTAKQLWKLLCHGNSIQSLQFMLKQEQRKGNISCKKCSSFTGWNDSRGNAYHSYGRYVPQRKGGHLLLINEILADFSSVAHIDNFQWQVIDIVPEYKTDYIDKKFVPKTQEILPDGTTFIPDIRVRFIKGGDEQVIWFIEADNGTESIIAPRKDYVSDTKSVSEESDMTLLDPACLIYKLLIYRNYINSYSWEKYGVEGKVVAVQCLFVFQSGLRADRFRQAVLDAVKRDQNFVWILCLDKIVSATDFWLNNVWFKAISEPEPFSIINSNGIEIDRFNL